jgi:hypothetical protein
LKVLGKVSKYVTNGSKTAVMDRIYFLCASLDSSRVQLHCSLGSCDCKLYEGQRAAVMDILAEKSKIQYPKSVTKLLRLEARGKILWKVYVTP